DRSDQVSAAGADIADVHAGAGARLRGIAIRVRGDRLGRRASFGRYRAAARAFHREVRQTETDFGAGHVDGWHTDGARTREQTRSLRSRIVAVRCGGA